MMDQELRASQAAAQAWGIPVDAARATSVTRTYPWCHRFEVSYVCGPEFRTALVAGDGSGTLLRFVDERGVPRETNRAARLAALNDLLSAESVSLPDGLSAIDLARAVRTFVVSPGGWVGSLEFLEEQKKTAAFDLWTYAAPHLKEAARHTQAERRELFTRAATDPVLEKNGAKWSLAFSYFTLGGAVERWQVEGDQSRIVAARDEIALPPNTFSPPVG